jgi:hypothetical protein
MMNKGCILLLKTVKKEAKDILVAEQGEAECPYCALLHAECTHDSSPTPCDYRPPILHCLHEDF